MVCVQHNPHSTAQRTTDMTARNARSIRIDITRFAEASADVRRRRDAAIAEMAAAANEAGSNPDPVMLGITYDMEMAPLTTNRKQLHDRGVFIPDPAEVEDGALEDCIMFVAVALSYLGIYFVHTDHLDSRTLYERICLNILDEQIREMPTDEVATEFIDLLGTGPLAEKTRLAHYATDEERLRAGGVAKAAGHNRDARLPHPNFPSRIPEAMVIFCPTSTV